MLINFVTLSCLASAEKHPLPPRVLKASLLVGKADLVPWTWCLPVLKKMTTSILYLQQRQVLRLEFLDLLGEMCRFVYLRESFLINGVRVERKIGGSAG